MVELIGGADGPALALCQAALAAGKPVVTANKALLAHHGAELARLADADRRHDRLRGGGRGRHPDRQDAARGPRRQPHPARLRHPERHLQLHPDDDARDRPRVRGGAAGGPAAGLRRGRSELRHRRHRRRPQARRCSSALAFGCPPDFAGGLYRGHPPRLAARHRLRQRDGLPHQAARRRAPDRARPRAAGPPQHGADRHADQPGRGRVQRRGRRGRSGRRPRSMPGAAPAAARPPRRWSPTSPTSRKGARLPVFGVPSARLDAACRRRRWTATTAPTTSA